MKTSHKLPTINQTKKISQISGGSKNSNRPLYSEKTKTKIFFDKKRFAHKGYASTYNVEILNSFNP